jgi:hypothetical protein
MSRQGIECTTFRVTDLRVYFYFQFQRKGVISFHHVNVPLLTPLPVRLAHLDLSKHVQDFLFQNMVVQFVRATECSPSMQTSVELWGVLKNIRYYTYTGFDVFRVVA